MAEYEEAFLYMAFTYDLKYNWFYEFYDIFLKIFIISQG